MNSPITAPGADKGASTNAPILHPQGLSELLGQIDLVICDLWGVMHNGITADTAAIDALVQLRAAGKASVFLSNAPRPRYHVRNMLLGMGMPDHLTDLIVTSGGLARDAVRSDYAGAKLYHLGPESDHNTVEGLPVDLVHHPDEADVILATDLDYHDIEKHRHLLAKARERGVPLLCANPDRVVHVGEKLHACAGAVADLYEAMGGPVRWFGKPVATALHACLHEAKLPDIAADRVVMIGDSLQTDIAGAKAASFRSLLIAGGIHRDEWPATESAFQGGILPQTDFYQIYGRGKPVPDWIMRKLVW